MAKDFFYIKKLIFIFTSLCLSLGELRGEGILLSRKEMHQVRGSFLYPALIVSGILILVRDKIQELDGKIRLHFNSDDLVLDSQQKKINDMFNQIALLHETKRALQRNLKHNSNL